MKHQPNITSDLTYKPFSFVTTSPSEFLTEKEIVAHKQFLIFYLERLIKHSLTDKCRVIKNKFNSEEINQADFYAVKEPIPYLQCVSIQREIQLITNQINNLENE